MFGDPWTHQKEKSESPSRICHKNWPRSPVMVCQQEYDIVRYHIYIIIYIYYSYIVVYNYNKYIYIYNSYIVIYKYKIYININIYICHHANIHLEDCVHAFSIILLEMIIAKEIWRNHSRLCQDTDLKLKISSSRCAQQATAEWHNWLQMFWSCLGTWQWNHPIFAGYLCWTQQAPSQRCSSGAEVLRNETAHLRSPDTP